MAFNDSWVCANNHYNNNAYPTVCKKCKVARDARNPVAASSAAPAGRGQTMSTPSAGDGKKTWVIILGAIVGISVLAVIGSKITDGGTSGYTDVDTDSSYNEGAGSALNGSAASMVNAGSDYASACRGASRFARGAAERFYDGCIDALCDAPGGQNPNMFHPDYAAACNNRTR